MVRIWSVRIVRELRHGDEAIGGTELDALIVRTEVMDVAEPCRANSILSSSRSQQRMTN
jgi:hypothetical protein